MSKGARAQFGDFQTPDALADAVVSQLKLQLASSQLPSSMPRSIVEPTCGRGSLLRAAARHFPDATLLGFELDATHADAARASLPAERTQISVANFFHHDWEHTLRALPAPILVLGNPPWVTSAQLGALGSSNLPEKHNWRQARGLDAITGKSNFDVSESIILRLLAALCACAGHDGATLAMLCKSLVARRVLEQTARDNVALQAGGLWRIDAQRAFGAQVDASWFVARLPPMPASATSDALHWPCFASLQAREPERWLGHVDGRLVPDAASFARTADLTGSCQPEWRSGIKHDCAPVMELMLRDGVLHDAGGSPLELEAEQVFPLLKSSDLAHGRSVTQRRVVVTQRQLGADTTQLATHAPKTWAYLQTHAARLAARKSAIYRAAPPFAMFGVGGYSFAPWKVAVSGLYKRRTFTLVGPQNGQPTLLDDTCYFLPFAERTPAERALRALCSARAAEFFEARVFWDDKRPINKTLLQALDLERVQRELDARELGTATIDRATAQQSTT